MQRTATATAPPPAPGARPQLRRGALGMLGAGLVGSLLVYHQLWTDPAHLTLGSANHTNDPMQVMWFLKWVPWQLGHGHDPFTTHALYYPGGVSLTWNTLMPTLALLAAPLTFTAGPAVTFAVLMTLAPALSSLTGYCWLRRHTRRAAPAAVGGLVVAFNPFVAGHLVGHLNLTFVALVPVILMLCEDLLWRRPRPTARTACYLGLVTAAQAGISEELILITAVGAALAFAAAALVDGPAVRTAVRSSRRGFALAVAVFLAAAAPILVPQLFLSRRVPLNARHWRARVGDYLAPLGRQLIEPNWRHASLVGGAEDGVYVGPLLAAVIVLGVALTARRDRWVRVGAAALGGLVVLTFGVSGPHGIPLPGRLLAGLPVFESILPVRFSFASYLVIAWLLTRWLDALGERPTPSGRQGAVTGVAGVAAVLAALVTIVPRQVGASSLPAPVRFFTSQAMRSVLPNGAPVLLLPVADFHDASGMYYQAQADFRFTQPSGYALRPDGPDGVSYGPPDTPLVRLGGAARNGALRRSDVEAGRRQLTAQGYRAIVVVRAAPGADGLTRLAEMLTGRPADRDVGGALVWLLTPH